jgi:hypothetical protein
MGISLGPQGPASRVYLRCGTYACEGGEARAEILHSVKYGLRVRRGEGRKGREHDKKGQLARKEFEKL